MERSVRKPEHPIRAVARLTSIPIETLRAWERRYRVVEPRRDGRGRLYSQTDVAKLRLLRMLVNRGHAIGRLASLSLAELEELAAAGTVLSSATADHGVTGETEAVDLDPALMAIERYDAGGLDGLLGRLAAVLSPRDLVLQVTLTLMRSVGEAWRNHRMTIAQEHLATASLRNLMGALVRQHAVRDPHAVVLFATPSDEHHEFGILAAAMLAVGGGMGALYLGTDLPHQEITEAARHGAARAVVLGVTGAVHDERAVSATRAIARGLPRGVELWTGGALTRELACRLQEAGATFLPDFSALEGALMRLGARF